MSEQFNEKFLDENPSTFWNGFVLIDAASDGRTVHFVVRDDDHPIDAVLH